MFNFYNFYEVHLIKNVLDPEVFYISEPLHSLFDCNEFLHWLSCQLSTAIHYRIVKYNRSFDGNYVCTPYPASRKKPTKCKYYPPTPLYMNILRRRRNYREEKKLYYEY